MTPENFIYWLQGYLELSDAQHITLRQTEIIKQHLKLVLTNVTDDSEGFLRLKTGHTGVNAAGLC